jgi:competence protein ComFB
MAGDITAEKNREQDPINVNEELVKQNVRRIMEELGACRCETCFANACALVLNELKPKYVTSEKGALLSKIDSIDVSSQASLTVEVTKAVMKVKNNPHH